MFASIALATSHHLSCVCANQDWCLLTKSHGEKWSYSLQAVDRLFCVWYWSMWPHIYAILQEIVMATSLMLTPGTKNSIRHDKRKVINPPHIVHWCWQNMILRVCLSSSDNTITPIQTSGCIFIHFVYSIGSTQCFADFSSHLLVSYKYMYKRQSTCT